MDGPAHKLRPCDRGARRLAVLLLRTRRWRLPCDGSLDREYRDDRIAAAGLRLRISDADTPARGARGLICRASIWHGCLSPICGLATLANGRLRRLVSLL